MQLPEDFIAQESIDFEDPFNFDDDWNGDTDEEHWLNVQLHFNPVIHYLLLPMTVFDSKTLELNNIGSKCINIA